ncbi:MAG TPA: cysteine desulfurase [Ktedonobacterales bacterium]|jgi:cysteine desulfurase/selenocysteine lyase|nr:cysteine desulfurase [Ktedonobacterales bacterium]
MLDATQATHATSGDTAPGQADQLASGSAIIAASGAAIGSLAPRADFPILAREINGKPLTFLDSAASSQKPTAVLEAMDHFARTSYANIHRGAYTLSEEATRAYERARKNVAKFIGARSAREVIFTRNTTESINLVARTWADANLRAGDAILLSEMEHHSNIVPWQLAAQRTGARVYYIPITDEGELDLAAYDALLERHRPKLVALTQMSNVLGTVTPLPELITKAHAVGALFLVDGAQGAPHLPVDVRALDCDFYAFSGHKMLGPSGIGVLWGRAALLEAMPPFLGGGDMIREVTLEGTTYNDLPWKYEAGTPAIIEAIGLGAAVDYLRQLDMEQVRAHERALTVYALERLRAVPDLTIFGPPAERRGGVISFTLGDIHAHDLATLLDREGVAVRAGHHCAQPLMERLNVAATARASVYVYTTSAEVDTLAEALERARAVFAL